MTPERVRQLAHLGSEQTVVDAYGVYAIIFDIVQIRLAAGPLEGVLCIDPVEDRLWVLEINDFCSRYKEA